MGAVRQDLVGVYVVAYVNCKAGKEVTGYMVTG